MAGRKKALEYRHRFAAMAHLILPGRRQLRRSLRKRRIEEYGIVAEAPRASRLESDPPFAGGLVLEYDLTRVGERHGTDEAGGSIRLGDVLEKLEKPRVLQRIGGSRAEEARRLDPRYPSEGIDLETGVLRHCGQAGRPVVIERFQPGVLTKRGAGFVRRIDRWKIVE